MAVNSKWKREIVYPHRSYAFRTCAFLDRQRQPIHTSEYIRYERKYNFEFSKKEMAFNVFGSSSCTQISYLNFDFLLLVVDVRFFGFCCLRVL